jgi:hypothetical protein
VADLVGLREAAKPGDARVAAVTFTQSLRGGPLSADSDRDLGGQGRERVEQHIEALAGLMTPEEEDRQPVGLGRRCVSEAADVDAVEEELVGASKMASGQLRRWFRDRDADIDAVGEATQRDAEPPVRSPFTCRWKVATTGAGRASSAGGVMLGARGSWRWRTSKPPRWSARTVRTAAVGCGAIGATDPFTRNRNDRPTLVPPSSLGTSPGAMIATPCPRRSSARARPRTWSCTPPGAEML